MTDGSIFAAALSKSSPEERAAFLDEACKGNPELRREVEALLQAHENAGSFLQRPLLSETATLLPPTGPDGAHAGRIPSTSVESPGTRIGPYKLLQQIGEGGMGSVWMAEQTEPVRRTVALKLIKAGMDSAQVIARFEAERQALALMDHPNIARVLDAGSSDSGRPYFVMELVKGTPITKYCDDHRLSIRQRLELFVSVCQALQHAHQKGIIHRDIKPSNVLIAPYDGRPVVKVIDFGVAKATGQRLTERTMFTEFGAIIGTLQYMSPEQAELNNQDIDTRSDIYSLGVLLYELLTGTTPIDMPQLRGAGFAAILMLIQEEEPPRPSTRLSDSNKRLPEMSAQRHTDPVRLTKLVRGELDWIVMRALEKDRGRRYETANGLARDIENYLNEEAVEACPPSTRYRLQKFSRKHRAALLTTGALLGLLVAGVLVSTWQAIRARQMEREAVAERDRAIVAQAEAENARQGEAKQREVAQSLAVAQTRATRTATDALEKARVAAAAESKARQAESEQREQAQASARRAERALYFNSISLANQYWLSDNLQQSERILDRSSKGLRGWEWQYLHGLNHADLLTLPGNGQFTTGLQFSRDGKRMAAFSQSGDAGARVWDLTTRQPLAEISLVRTQRLFNCFALSSDGKMVALGDATGKISFWDAGTGKLLREFVKLARPANSLSFSPDGQRLAAACADARRGEMLLPLAEPARNEDLIVWDTATGKELFHPKGFGLGAEFSPDGTRLVTFKRNSAIRLTSSVPEFFFALFDTENWKEVAPGELGSGNSFSFSGDSKWLALGGKDRQRDASFIRVVSAASGKERLALSPSAVGDIALDPEGNVLVVCGAFGSNSFEVWDLNSKKRSGTIRGHLGSVNAVACAPDGRIASCAWDNTIKFWNLASVKTERVLTTSNGHQILPALLGPGGDLLAYGQANAANIFTGPIRTATLVDAATGKVLHTLGGHAGGTWKLAFNLGGTRLATGGRKGEIKVWDVAKGSLIFTRPGAYTPSALALSPDGQWAASANESKEYSAFSHGDGQLIELPVSIQVWNASTGQERWKLDGHSVQVLRLAFSPDGKWLASSDYRLTKIWDLSTGKWVRDLVQPQPWAGAGTALLFSPAGDLLATSGGEKVQVWDVASGQSIAYFEGHPRLRSECVAINPDQTRLATAGGREIKIWDLRSGQEALTLPVPQLDPNQGPVESIAWSKDGKRLRGALLNASVLEWSGEPRNDPGAK